MKIKLSDPKIFVVTIAWLIILVFVGTVDQKYIGLYAAQNKYFSSLMFWFWYIPLPGGMLTMFILTCNLMTFLLQKNIWNTKKMGVIIIHLGSILLLIGGGITYFFSFEGAMPITTRNKISNFMYSYHDKELVIINENEYQNIKVAEIICDILDNTLKKKSNKIKTYKELITSVNDRPAHDRKYSLNTEKIKSQLH